MKKIVLFIGIVILMIALSFPKKEPRELQATFWEFQSIDTMKYSRDLSREKLTDPTFNVIIDEQMKNIANTGATHVAIATPYDEEFLPILRRWVSAARKYNLSIWFRGNWSGWEQWFGYDKISREEHKQKTDRFIRHNPDLFENGDIFSACPECENGGPGDPRHNGDTVGHRKFLIEEYDITRHAFADIGKKVNTSFNSMNGDVARLIMDKETTRALGGIVVIDHYVSSPDTLVFDIAELAEQSGGHIVLGEFGVPISDIHGAMSEEEQQAWIEEALSKMVQEKSFAGVNYWVNVGGSTELWNAEGAQRSAVKTLESFYNPPELQGKVIDETGKPIGNVYIENSIRNTTTDSAGIFTLPFVGNTKQLTAVSVEGYRVKKVLIENLKATVILEKANPPVLYKLQRFVMSPFI